MRNPPGASGKPFPLISNGATSLPDLSEPRRYRVQPIRAGQNFAQTKFAIQPVQLEISKFAQTTSPQRTFVWMMCSASAGERLDCVLPPARQRAAVPDRLVDRDSQEVRASNMANSCARPTAALFKLRHAAEAVALFICFRQKKTLFSDFTSGKRRRFIC